MAAHRAAVNAMEDVPIIMLKYPMVEAVMITAIVRLIVCGTIQIHHLRQGVLVLILQIIP